MIIKKQRLIEISSMIFFLLLVSLLNYFFIVGDAINAFFFEKNREQMMFNALSQKQALAKKDKLLSAALLAWQQKNPLLYEATQHTSDYLFSEVTSLIQNTGFTISRIQPIRLQDHAQKNKDLLLQTSLNGNYFLLFYLIEAINKNSWPIRLADIRIDNKNQFQLRFALRDQDE